MTKLSTFALAFLLSSMLFSCDATSSSEETTTETTTTTTPSIEEQPSTPKSIELVCKSLGMDEYENPKNEVVLRVDGKEKTIAQILACEPIGKADYERHEIPATAVVACGGWWAGAGDYFYAILENNQVVVYIGWQSEEQEEPGFHWEKVDLSKL